MSHVTGVQRDTGTAIDYAPDVPAGMSATARARSSNRGRTISRKERRMAEWTISDEEICGGRYSLVFDDVERRLRGSWRRLTGERDTHAMGVRYEQGAEMCGPPEMAHRIRVAAHWAAHDNDAESIKGCVWGKNKACTTTDPQEAKSE